MAGTLAIDLGSTTTVVAHQGASDQAARLLPLPPFSSADPVAIPSLIWLTERDASQPLIGRQVVEGGFLECEGPQLQRDFKRLIAQPSSEANHSWLTPEQSGRLLLEQIWSHLPEDLAPDRLVLTAPIDGYRGYRQWLLEAVEAMDVPDVALVDEPTAAAIGAGLAPGSRVLVVDVGGGTTDLSLVALPGGEGRAAPIAQLLRFGGRNLNSSQQTLRTAEVLGKAGLAIGGRDLDHWIAAHLCPDLPHPPRGLLQVCERLKCELSAQEEALALWTPAGVSNAIPLRLQRADLEQLLEDQGLLSLLDELLETVLAAARAAGVQSEDIDAILPVGGSAQIPLIRQWLQQRLPGTPLRGSRPVEAVALGALSLTPGVRIKDVLSQGVSLRCWDQRSAEHRWHPLFMAGQSWPIEQPLVIRLSCSEAEQNALELVLGEPQAEERSEVVFVDGLPVLRRKSAGAARVKAWAQTPIQIPLTPCGTPGEDRMELRFWIDSACHLQVESLDLQTQTRQSAMDLGAIR
ncbi:Hsp70 family protein [Synechococcus sp. A10-1-5-1]|uniref:Hsp70 family protein n=1 Tax=Synechococcus sp. A10-1-5-1 TaxID=2936507 RepID=UPI0020006995|nr:Hsp70 family protein [Synechococcus sp. A10-1-5-1]UPM49846.1 Hsp70 family protein [Synechococcus sp. A10-1-5-1]